MSTKIAFLILPHTNLLDLGGASQVFHEAIDQGLDIELSFCAYDKPSFSSIGLSFGKIETYKKRRLNKGDYLFISSACYTYIFSKKFNPENDILDWLVKLHEKGVILCAICTGAFLLGKAGLLDGIKCTTHWKRTAELQSEFPNSKIQHNCIFVEDNGIYTSAGANSAIDVALHILAQFKDDYFVHKIARELVVYHRRNGNDRQQSAYLSNRNHIHNGIHRVQDYIQDNIHQKHHLNKLAEMANMSHRNFCRVFKKETELTVIEYVNKLRKERIVELMKNPDLSRLQIAKECGLKSERHLSRLINNFYEN